MTQEGRHSGLCTQKAFIHTSTSLLSTGRLFFWHMKHKKVDISRLNSIFVFPDSVVYKDVLVACEFPSGCRQVSSSKTGDIKMFFSAGYSRKANFVTEIKDWVDLSHRTLTKHSVLWAPRLTLTMKMLYLTIFESFSFSTEFLKPNWANGSASFCFVFLSLSFQTHHRGLDMIHATCQHWCSSATQELLFCIV